jgi:hypothetical protein
MFDAFLIVLIVGLPAVLLLLIGLARIVNWLHEFSRWVRYAYFLRFSLMLWLFAPALCAANMYSQTLTSGIVAPETWEQYMCVGFFLLSASFASLILARIVLINGPERWDHGYNAENDARPKRLAIFFDNDSGEHELASLLTWQFPNVLVFLYLTINGCRQGIWAGAIVGGLAAGTIVAFCFWWIANAFYYLTFVAIPQPPPPKDAPAPLYVLGLNAARTILFPRSWFRLNKINDPFPGRPTIEQAKTKLPAMKIRDKAIVPAGLEGYGRTDNHDFYLYEAQYFAIIALFSFLTLYGAFWPLAAPVPAPVMSWIVIGFLVLIGIGWLCIFWTATARDGTRPIAMQVLLSIGVVVFLGSVITLYWVADAERFPIFATILILVTFVCWSLAGFAFFFDRYRVPVVTLIIACMVAPRFAHLDRAIVWHKGPRVSKLGREEHYLSTLTLTETIARSHAVSSPAAILQDRLDGGDGRPLIVVTATGGGLHASAWTAAVLANLEADFGGDFHKHLLLMSTVSGGSVGLLAYLRELHEGTLDGDPQLAYRRMQSAARCSGLESVGWGLIYYDLPKAFVPVFPYFIRPARGDDNLDASPLGKDRTWSLRKAFARNLNNSYCDWLWARDTNIDPEWNKNGPSNSPGAWGLTLRQLTAGKSESGWLPAFTMNTASAEDGQRFLLANYDVPDLGVDDGLNYRAKSFLGTFGQVDRPDGRYFDLPLPTAAQMSATFPYVSSASRMPVDVDDFVGSMHFVDGGYYDNDGTASAIEFLRYALAPSTVQSAESNPSSSAQDALTQEQGRLKAIEDWIAKMKHPVRVLLIEIRNSGDISPTGPELPGDRNGEKYPGNVLFQIGAPPTALWQAGHESVTARNRTGLALLEKALSGKLEVHRITFADDRTQDVTGTDPLNWSLTPAQRTEVTQSADPNAMLKAQYQEAKTWFYWSPEQWCGHGDGEALAVPCTRKPGAAKAPAKAP